MKINIKVTINSNTQTQIMTSGIYKENRYIEFIDNKIKIKFDCQTMTLKKEDQTSILTLCFRQKEHTNGNYYLKEMKKSIILDLYTECIITKEKYYKINYTIENEENFEFILTFEEVQ